MPTVDRLTGTRIPTEFGEFTLSLYDNSEDEKDHLALIHGDIAPDDEVLVRIHSECFTGDVLGSLRCDCGAQLRASMRKIADQGQGVLLYLRQEGRGIGLLSKLRAYDLQDEGYDTVEANHLLGHEADERDYSIGALILEDLGIQTVRLLTNNPEKIESLDQHGVDVVERVPLGPHLTQHNEEYLRTKVDRMRHMLELDSSNGTANSSIPIDLNALHTEAQRVFRRADRPFLTLTYAQSIDGSIASPSGQPLRLSGDEAMAMTHALRASHDAILVGIGTVLADDPRLNVRHQSGAHPRPVVLDSRLRFPLEARLLECEGPCPIIITSAPVTEDRRVELEARGATVVVVAEEAGGISLNAALRHLVEQGIQSVMVEGGSAVLTSFLRQQLADKVIVTVAPQFVGGTAALTSDEEHSRKTLPRLQDPAYHTLGEDLIIEGHPVWATE